MHIRQLTLDDLADYRALHRYGIGEAPASLVDTAETDAAQPDAVVAAALERGDGWGVFDGARLMGKLTIDALPFPSLAHTFWVHAVYVHPDARGTGASADLMGAAIEHVRKKGAARIALWVNAENAAARRSYERLGFRETGRIPQGISQDGRRIDDVLMFLALD